MVGLPIALCLVPGCKPSRNEQAGEAREAPPGHTAGAPAYAGDLTQEQYQRAKEEALGLAQKQYEARMRNPPTNQIRLPNYETGPGRPLPVHVNFYTTDDRYPAYLECEYDVKETDYDQSNEPKWFEAALEQMRDLGPKRFSAVRWVAVCIVNRAEHKGISTFEPSFKVGTVFKATEVFDGSSKPSQLIARVDMDRHPFVFDRTQPTPGEQQRWVVVERHAAANPK